MDTEAAIDAYRMLLASLPASVARARHLRIPSHGMLYLLPFAAVMREPGATLLQTTTITYVDSARDILVPPPATPARAAVIGDPDYYANTDRLPGEQLDDVPAGEAELAAVREVLPRARFWTRADATKERLMSLHGPIVLHVGPTARSTNATQLVTLWPVLGETTARLITHVYRARADSLPRQNDAIPRIVLPGRTVGHDRVERSGDLARRDRAKRHGKTARGEIWRDTYVHDFAPGGQRTAQ